MKIKKLSLTILPVIVFFIFSFLPNTIFAADWWTYTPPPPETTFSVPTAGRGVASICSLPANPTLKIVIMNLIIGCILTRTAYLIVAAAIVVFLYGVFKFISSEGDDKQGGREFMFWGIVGIFVMISFWGIVKILQNTFGF